MSISVKELKDWLEHQHPDDVVWIDEGGLTLVNHDKGYLEVGGQPEKLPKIDNDDKKV